MKKKKLSHKELEKTLMDVFSSEPEELYTKNRLIQKLNLSNSRGAVQAVLNKLLKQHFVFEVKDGFYRLDKYVDHSPKSPKKPPRRRNAKDSMVGVVDRTKKGTAYIVVDKDKKDDVHISHKNLNWALHGDKVRIRLVKTHRRNLEGEVIEVLQRRTNRFIGKLLRYKNQSEVTVDDGKASFKIKVNNADIKDAQHQEMVLVEVTKWPQHRNQSPMGVVIETLGDKNANDIEMRSILIKYGFQIDFPEAVIRETKKFSGAISPKEMSQRKDMRKVPTFTIDPESAKDFDDALSLQRHNDGTYEIGIHIADVSHYIREGSALDKEALKRATSVYLVDRVCPMLPEKLSNDLCSLRPNEDRRAYSAILTFDESHKIIKRWFGHSVINSDKRFSYKEAQERIEGKGDYSAEIQFLNKVAERLRKKRLNEGSINFETDEVEFVLDVNGKPLDIYLKEPLPAHNLIEELMLLANKEVAIYIHKKGEKAAPIPFIYRVHDEPDMEKVREFGIFAREHLGVKLQLQNARQVPKAFHYLTTQIQDRELVNSLQPLAIRTMAKAEYSTENIGHFGLGFKYYTHFTSPIRRYSDILVHRILDRNIGRDYRMNEKNLKDLAQHISAQERNAMDAERESISYKQAEFLQQSIGKTFRGVVNGLIDRGFFVELTASLAEGLVDWHTLDEDYVLDSNHLKAESKQSGNTISIGTKVKVRIEAVHLSRREVDMSLVSIH